MRLAVIDLGTNTFNLAIGQWNKGKLEYLHTEKDGVALGMGGINQNTISDDAIERAIGCLKRFKQKCNQLEVSEIKAIGTSAIRDAQNNLFFLEMVLENTGIVIEIIDGLREAELIFKGISYSYTFPFPSMIMDIGGGSTEFIYVENGNLKKSNSFDIGVSRIFQKLEWSDPMTTNEIDQIEAYLESKTGNFFDHLHAEVLIGASGSFETFYELVNQEKFPSGFEVCSIDIEEFKNHLLSIVFSTLHQREQNEFIVPIRKKMAPIAAVKTNWILKKLKVKKIVISPNSLKEGVFVENK